MSEIARGLLFVVAAPSGAGKTSLVNELVATNNDLQASVSHTTRAKRAGERDGIDYNFVDEATFRGLIAEEKFLEHAEVFGNLYGTSRDWVEDRLASGDDLILEIDWQGAQQIRKIYPDVIDIFIVPPSLGTLRHRLVSRGEDSADVIERRMAEAISEMSHLEEFRYLIVNDDFHHALADMRSVLRAARLGTPRQRIVNAGTIRQLLAL